MILSALYHYSFFYARIVKNNKRSEKMKKFQLATIIVASSAVIMFTGCATKAGTGAAVGAGGGALLGSAIGGSRGAVAGAALGGVTGAAIGANEDRKDRERYYRDGRYYYR
jgi:predicted small secreted protein